MTYIRNLIKRNFFYYVVTQYVIIFQFSILIVFKKKRAVEVITQSQLEAIKLKGIIRTGDESTASSSSSNIITKSSDNISSDGNVLQHIQIAESHNDRMSVA
jgi:hypothetical protein